MLYPSDDFDKLKPNIMKPILSGDMKVQYVYQSINMLKYPIIYRINADLIITTNKSKYHKQFIEQKEILKDLQQYQYYKTYEVQIWNI